MHSLSPRCRSTYTAAVVSDFNIFLQGFSMRNTQYRALYMITMHSLDIKVHYAPKLRLYWWLDLVKYQKLYGQYHDLSTNAIFPSGSCLFVWGGVPEQKLGWAGAQASFNLLTSSWLHISSKFGDRWHVLVVLPVSQNYTLSGVTLICNIEWYISCR